MQNTIPLRARAQHNLLMFGAYVMRCTQGSNFWFKGGTCKEPQDTDIWPVSSPCYQASHTHIHIVGISAISLLGLCRRLVDRTESWIVNEVVEAVHRKRSQRINCFQSLA